MEIGHKGERYLVDERNLEREHPYDVVLVGGKVEVVPWKSDTERTADLTTTKTLDANDYWRYEHALTDGSGEYIATVRLPHVNKPYAPVLFNVPPGHETVTINPQERWS